MLSLQLPKLLLGFKTPSVWEAGCNCQGRFLRRQHSGEDGPFPLVKNALSGWEIITLANKFYLQLFSLETGCLFCSPWSDAYLCKRDDLKVCANRWNSHGRWVMLCFWFYWCICRRLQVSPARGFRNLSDVSVLNAHTSLTCFCCSKREHRQGWVIHLSHEEAAPTFFHRCPGCLWRL